MFYPRGASKFVTNFYPSTLIHISSTLESSLPAAFLYCKRYRITPVKTNYHHQLNCILICIIFHLLWDTSGAYLNCCYLLACWHFTGCRKMVIPQCISLTSALQPIYACFCSYCSRPSMSKVRCCSVQRAWTQQQQYREGIWTSCSSGSWLSTALHITVLVQWRGNYSEGEARIGGWGQGARGISLIGFFPASSTFWALSAEGQSWRCSWLSGLQCSDWTDMYRFLHKSLQHSHVHPFSVLTDL